MAIDHCDVGKFSITIDIDTNHESKDPYFSWYANYVMIIYYGQHAVCTQVPIILHNLNSLKTDHL